MKYYIILNSRTNAPLVPHKEPRPPLHDNIVTEVSSLEDACIYFSAISSYIARTHGPAHNIAVREDDKSLRWLNRDERDIVMKMIVRQRNYEKQYHGESACRKEQDDLDARP